MITDLHCHGIKGQTIEALCPSILICATEAAISSLSISLASGYVVFHAVSYEVTFMPCLILDNYCLKTISHFKL